MSSALNPPRGPKPKGTQPSHYFESFLEKKGPCDQDYRRFWAGLQGPTIYFYSSNRDFQPLEKIELRTFVKLTDHSPRGGSRDPGIHFTLVLWDQEIKFKVESLESREVWKGFILTVVELRVPSNLTLLPGHLYMMAEVLAKEEARRALEVPSCFLKVSRLEAQLLLERYPECGNLLLRPSGDGKDRVSITTRQLLNGTPVIRHYKVKKEGAKYVIDVEDPVSCASLDAVVHYFVTHTKRALVPFLMEEDYEKVLGYVDADNENGENVWVSPSNRGSGDAPLHVATAGIGEEGPWTHSPSAHASCDACPIRAQTSRIELARSGPASLTNVPKPLPPVPVSVSSQDKLHPLPPLPQLPDQDESYVTPIDEVPAVEYMNQDVSPSSRPQVILKPKKLEKFPAKPPKPPIVPKPDLKAINGAWAKKLGGGSPQALSLVTRLGDVTAELQEKLQKRRALEH